MLTLILLVFAFVLLFCAAVGVATARVQLGWLGLALWVLAEIVGRWKF